MNIDLSDEAVEYGRLALRALESAGGDTLVQTAERVPHHRVDTVESVLGELGAWDLDPRGDADELEAAAALCRSAGYWTIASPVAERLARPTDLDADGLIVISEQGAAGAVAGLDLRWVAVSLDGRRSWATPRPLEQSPRRSAFVAELELRPIDDDGEKDVALGLVLPCWTLLGMLDRAIRLARDHVRDREQFGQPLAAFQGVQFQLTDAEVERCGVEALATYALWSIQTRRDEAIDDALALRLATIEAAEVVFRIAHQLHGATGFCDETTLSWVSRYSQPLRRLPFGPSATRDRLARRLGRRGLTGLFG
jgi:hypothetical protein